MHATLARLRQSRWLDVVWIAFAYGVSLAILVPEFGPEPLPTWHVMGDESARRLTAPGYWEFFVALPILNYVWIRLIWKTMLWTYYLYHVSRLKLDLLPAHPDMTGGIGFVSEAQGRFALLILAYGISNVAAPVGYQVAVLNYDLSVMPVWAPLLGFVIGAPLLFTLPLFMFTKQLHRSKEHALAAYRERTVALLRSFERQWLRHERSERREPAGDEVRMLAEQNALDAVYNRIHRMRVVPFDLRSFAQLLGSTFGAIATVLPLLHSKGELHEIMEVASKLLEKLPGGH